MLRTCRLDHLSVCVCVRKVYCGKTAGWIRMPFGVVRGVGLGMGALDFCSDRRRGRGSFGGVNLWRPIITNGDFVASLCGSAISDRTVVWHGEWGGPRHSYVRWKSTYLKGKGVVSGNFRHFHGFAYWLTYLLT